MDSTQAPEVFSPIDSPLDHDATLHGRGDAIAPRNGENHTFSRSENAFQPDTISTGVHDVVPAPLPSDYNDPTLINAPSPSQPRHLLPQVILNDLPPQPHEHGARTSSSHSPAEDTTQGLHHTPSPSVKPPSLPPPITPSPFLSPVLHPQATPRRPSTSSQGVLDVAARYPDADLLIQQETYRPNTQSDDGHSDAEAAPAAPILFFLQHPDRCGIPCRDAAGSRCARLVDRDDAMFVDEHGPAVSVRIHWPGCPPWSRQIPTRDFRSPPMPITRSRLAKNVAKTVQRFLADRKDTAMEAGGGARFDLAHIAIDQVELVGLQQVSLGAWQAHFRLRPRAGT